tara:strand:+ start:10616 stop:10879 length:264 start_codon:yes stop_codon:yes gene_type:complete
MFQIEKVDRIPQSKNRRKGTSIYLDPVREIASMPAGTEVRIKRDGVRNGFKISNTMFGSMVEVAKKNKIDNVKFFQRGNILFAKVLY